MKVGKVSLSAIAKSPGLQLGAEYYLDPYASDIEKCEAKVARLKKQLQTEEARLVMWKRMRENALKERR